MAQIKRNFGIDQFTYSYYVEPSHEGMRLDAFVKQFLGSASREFVKRKIEKGEITISGSGRIPPHRPSCKVHHQETVTMITNRPPGEGSGDPYVEHWNHQELDISEEKPHVVFEDQDLLIISKPPFMATHPTGKHFFNVATVYYEHELGHPVHSIHRLDRETSGLLALGKNPRISQEMASLFENRLIKKCYFLIAKKREQKSQITFPFLAQERIGNPDNAADARIFQLAFPEHSEYGKSASTYFELLHEEGDVIIALAFPRTGRQHQIRVHAAAHGFPLLGDKIYQGDVELFKRYKDNLATVADYTQMEIPRHALHAIALSIPEIHPDFAYNGKVFISSLPQDLKNWIVAHIRGIGIMELEEKIKYLVNSVNRESGTKIES